MKNEFDKWMFCSCCNHAITRIEWESIVAPFPCPHCRQTTLETFYQYGSYTHKLKWELWKNMQRAGESRTLTYNILRPPCYPYQG